MMKVIIKENGQPIGTLSIAQFMDYAKKHFGIGTHQFLAEYIRVFNTIDPATQAEITIGD